MSYALAFWLMVAINSVLFSMLFGTVKAFLRLREDYEDVYCLAVRYIASVKSEDCITLDELKLKYGRLEDQE